MVLRARARPFYHAMFTRTRQKPGAISGQCLAIGGHIGGKCFRLGHVHLNNPVGFFHDVSFLMGQRLGAHLRRHRLAIRQQA